MAELARRGSPGHLSSLFEWLDAPWPSFWPMSAQTFRVEAHTKDGRCVVRAELPGLDPDNDIEITVEAGVLTVHAERREERAEPHRSEFRYGSMSRSVALPPGADPDKITATYRQGILEVSVPVEAEQKLRARRIAIRRRD